jgi:hypothetical protein
MVNGLSGGLTAAVSINKLINDTVKNNTRMSWFNFIGLPPTKNWK